MAKSNSRSGPDRGRSRDDDDRKPRRTASPGAPAGPTQRMLRVGEMIRHELAALLSRGEIHDETLAATVVTIPEVRMSTDLKLATVYVMPLGGADVAPVIDALDRHKRFIRGEIAHTVNLRFAPDIRFREDESFEEATRIDRLLDSPAVRRDTRKQDGETDKDDGES